MGFVFGLMRTFIALIWTLVACTLALIALLLGKRVSGWVLTRIAGQFWSRPMLHVLSSRFEIIPPPDDIWPSHAIYIANHVSQLDINVVFGSIPHPVIFLSKDSIKKVPFLGWANSMVGTVFVERGSLESSVKAAADLKVALSEGKVVCVFPEGTRSADGTFAAFKKGAFRLALEADVPIVPMWIDGTREALAKGDFIIRRRPIRVAFGAPIPSKTDAGEQHSIEVLMSASRSAMIQLSNQMDQGQEI